MTLLRRAPREVYRVYGEEEFFADTTAHDDRVGGTALGSGDRQLQRLAGVTVLLAAVGAVGGVIVITSISPSSSRRRGGARSPAASGSSLAVNDRAASMNSSASKAPAPDRPADGSGSGSRAGGGKQQARSRRPALPAQPHRGRERIALAEDVNVADPEQAAQSVNGRALVSVADSSARTPAVAAQPVQGEFGFER
jgi:hypothetical protein